MSRHAEHKMQNNQPGQVSLEAAKPIGLGPLQVLNNSVFVDK